MEPPAQEIKAVAEVRDLPRDKVLSLTHDLEDI